jgi:iron complex outermembrane receptor protein
LTDDLDLHGSVAYTHARYIDFTNAPGYTLNPANPATLGGLLYANVPENVDGKTMVRSPEFTASVTLSYHKQLNDSHRLEVTLSPYYSTRVFFTFDNTAAQAPYATLDGKVSLTLGEHMKVSVFGHNMTDSKYALNNGQNAFGLNEVKYAPPASYGVSFGYQF